MVRSKGVEPLAYALEERCSIQLSYERIKWRIGWDSNPRTFLGSPVFETGALDQLCDLSICYDGGVDGIRTHAPELTELTA